MVSSNLWRNDKNFLLFYRADFKATDAELLSVNLRPETCYKWTHR